jgi:CubicO group peptidase (beta-lactamase class C family)
LRSGLGNTTARRKAPVLLLGLVLLLPACDRPPEPAAFAEQLEALLPRLLRHHRGAGVAVAFVADGEVVGAQGYGWADRASRRAVTPETVFNVGSISKAVTAWGVLRLVEQGQLDLDARVERYLTRWRLPPSHFDHEGVTIRRLLCHTAGLSQPAVPGYARDVPLPTLEEMLVEGDVRVSATPGAMFRYSGGGYTVLQLAVEEVSGQPFADYMQREILEPLGMTHSGFDETPALLERAAVPHDDRGRPLPRERFAATAAAGLYTTAPDLARFLAAALPGPKGEPAGRGVLTPTTVEQMLTPAANVAGLENDGPDRYGLGYFLETLPGGAPVVSHGGRNEGWVAYFAALPRRRTGVVILTNSDRGSRLPFAVLHAWAAWAGDGLPRQCQTFATLRGLARMAAGVLWLGLVGWAGWLVVQLRTGSRRLGWPPQRPAWQKAIQVLLVLALGALWIVLGQRLLRDLQPLFDVVPTPSHWAVLAAVLWYGAIVVTVFASKVKPAPQGTPSE